MSFWANKLNGTTPTQQAPLSRDLYGMYRPVEQPIQQPNFNPGPQQPLDNYSPSVPMTPSSMCPGCGSSNYIGVPVEGRTAACPDCGYHPRFRQSGYSTPRRTTGLRVEGNTAQPARQTSDSSSLNASIAMLNAGQGTHINSI